MQFSAYSDYKNSGVEWLGEVPEHWNIFPIGHGLEPIKNNNVGEDWNKTQLLSLTLNGIIERDINSGKGKSHSDYSTYQRIEKGDFVFCLFDIEETPRTVGLSTKQGMITSAYTAFKPNHNVEPKFLYYLFESIDEVKGFGSEYSGLRKTIRPTRFVKLNVCYPTIDEQNQIAEFLDNETAKIDNLIAKQEQLIVLLEEQRKSVISHAVTKGLDPNVSMKDSGVEWLGEVPRHWDVVPSKFYFTERGEKAESQDRQLTASQHQGIVFQDDYMADKGRVMVVMKNPEILKKVKPLDFVISMRSFQGGLELSYIEGCISSAYVILIPNLDFIEPEFFKYLFKSRRYIQALQSTSNLVRDGQALRFYNFSQVKLAIPPKNEQIEIADYITQEMLKINQLIQKQQQLIEQLKEYRTSVISHAVTGKIDIRGLV